MPPEPTSPAVKLPFAKIVETAPAAKRVKSQTLYATLPLAPMKAITMHAPACVPVLSSAVLGMLLNRRVVAHCVFATEACLIGGTFSSALLGSLLDDAIGVSAALSFPVVLAAIASTAMGLLAAS